MTHHCRTLLAAVAVSVALACLARHPGPAEAAPPAPHMQRMLINAGCYRIGRHATGTIAAYCLDQAGTAPGRGMILGETPALGDATVSIGGKTMTLKAALDSHLMRVEGTDTPDRLALVNTTDRPLSLCVDRPVVVMGNGFAYSMDLRRIYDEIADLMRLDRPDTHEGLQRRLWSLVNTADEPDTCDVKAGTTAMTVLCQ